MYTNKRFLLIFLNEEYGSSTTGVPYAEKVKGRLIKSENF